MQNDTEQTDCIEIVYNVNPNLSRWNMVSCNSENIPLCNYILINNSSPQSPANTSAIQTTIPSTKTIPDPAHAEDDIDTNVLQIISIICSSLICIVCMIMIIFLTRTIPIIVDRDVKNESMNMHKSERNNNIHVQQQSTRPDPVKIKIQPNRMVPDNSPFRDDKAVRRTLYLSDPSWSSSDSDDVNRTVLRIESRMEGQKLNPQIQEIEKWLNTMNLSMNYVNHFVSNGFDSMEMIMEIEHEQELLEIEITSQADLRILMDSLVILRKREHHTACHNFTESRKTTSRDIISNV